MSQIGSGEGGLEMIGRLLGGTDGGKAGRVAARLGGGASDDFARLMASAKGRLEGGATAPPPVGAGPAETALPKQLRSALTALGEEIARLRQRAATDAPGQVATGSGDDRELQGMLDRMAEALSATGESDAAGRGGIDGSDTGREATRRPDAADPLAPEASRATASMADRLAGDERFAAEVAGLAEALEGWREALEAGVPAEIDKAASALRDQLAALRESIQVGVDDAAEPPAGLAGVLQPLQQLMARAESPGPAETPATRAAGEARGWSDWAWRLNAAAQSNAARSGNLPTAGASSTSGDKADWSGGPVTAALGLAGREAPAPLREERTGQAQWSAAASAGRSSDAGMEALSASALFGQGSSASSSSLTAGPSAGGVFTGQSATPPPNPQMPAQLGQQIQWMVGKGVSRANIELRPADLGPLKISIETQGDETRIALTATNATTQGLLEQQLPRLKEWLQESGLADSEVDVSLGEEGGFGQQLADADRDDPEGRAGLTSDTGTIGAGGFSADGEGDVEWVEGQGVLDLFA